MKFQVEVVTAEGGGRQIYGFRAQDSDFVFGLKGLGFGVPDGVGFTDQGWGLRAFDFALEREA